VQKWEWRPYVFAPLLRSPKIPCVLMLNAASQMVGSQESEIAQMAGRQLQ